MKIGNFLQIFCPGSVTSPPYANSDAYFRYIDLWSSTYTWGAKDIPKKGEMVIISEGQTIMIDGHTEELLILLVEGGHVVFDDSQDCHLRAKNILITNGGSITAGTEEVPFARDLTIELFGTAQDLELPVYGSKTLAVREGLVSLHGIKKRPAWTQLSEAARAGDFQIRLLDDVNWRPGDEIVIVSTGGPNSMDQNELRKVVGVFQNEVVLNLPLNFDHLGHIEKLENGQELDMRAEVGVLTRNVVLKGDEETSDRDSFGACLMVGPSKPGTIKSPSKGNLQLSNIEVKNSGQIFKIARYPVHAHFLGHTENSFIRGISVHKSNNRAIVLHHTDNLSIENSVAFDIKGGAIFIEDGIERYNKIVNNLVVGVKATNSLQLDDLTPAAIWVTNPNNYIIGNHIAGCEHFGIWYRMHKHPEKGSFNKDVCQQHEPFGVCDNNVAHSLGGIGLWIFETYVPYEGSGIHESCITDVISPAKIKNFQTYRVNKGVEFFEVGAVQLHNSAIAETTKVGVEWKRLVGVGWNDKERGALMNKITISARTSKYAELENIHDNDNPEVALVVPATSGLYINDTTFIGYDQSDSAAVGGTDIVCLHSKGNGGFESRFDGITWIDTNLKDLPFLSRFRV